MTPAMTAAAAAHVLLPFRAVEIVLPSTTLRLAAAGSPVKFPASMGGLIFLPEDDTFGTLSSIDGFDEEVGVMAPGLSIGILPPSQAAFIALASPANQNAEVSMWWGLLDPATGLAVEDPELEFTGFFDRPRLTLAKGVRRVELEIVSVWERLFAGNEGQRLRDAWLQAQHPGDKGLEFVNGVEQQIPWGGDGPRPQAISVASVTGSVGFAGGRVSSGFNIRYD